MKIKTPVLTVLILLTVSFTVMAKKNPARPFFLQSPITMDGVEISEGMYELALESNNSTVTVTLWRDGRFVATARGIWVKSGVKYKENVVLLRVNSDGTRSLVEIRLSGTAKTIVLNKPDTVFSLSAK